MQICQEVGIFHPESKSKGKFLNLQSEESFHISSILILNF